MAATQQITGAGTVQPIWEEPRRPIWVQAINVVGDRLGRNGTRWPELNAEAIISAAQRRTRLTDFGDNGFREGLNQLVDSFNAQDSAHPFGRLVFREHCTGLLIDRLKIQDEVNRHPEILQVPVDRPLFITGLPRTGTTLLQRLMSVDPSCRTLLNWEAAEPYPAPRPDTYKTDSRILRQRIKLAMAYQVAPGLKRAHEFEARSPDEDNDLHSRSFNAGIFGFLYDVPGFVRWLENRDYTQTYRCERQQLQLLSWKHRGDYWVLKAPSHMFTLEALLTVFPDANIVFTHRNPSLAIASLCSLQATVRAPLEKRIDLRRLGVECLENFCHGPERAIEFRRRCNPGRFFDIAYERLVADPIETVRAICRYFGYNFSLDYEMKARRFLEANPRGKHGVHRYRLEDFGLDKACVERAFAPYIEWLKEHQLPG